MELKQVKQNLNRKVKHNGVDYILTGCIIRLNENGEFYYQAELRSTKATNSLVYCKLKEVNCS